MSAEAGVTITPSRDDFGLLLDFVLWLFDSSEYQDEHHRLIHEFLARHDA